jgi:hypothetical protein
MYDPSPLDGAVTKRAGHVSLYQADLPVRVTAPIAIVYGFEAYPS